jgi:hypothetical protein
MKKTLSILFLGTALTLTACGKDKKAASDPAAAAPAAADPAKPADPAAAAPAAPAAGGDQAKPEDKKGGW